jgi:hypothetical protein
MLAFHERNAASRNAVFEVLQRKMVALMNLNLGCGSKKLPGWVNVDKISACEPDQVVNLEQFPWPWPDNSVDEVLLSHVLEHLGAATDVYLNVIKELYRVCRDDAKITIVVPHPRHDHFLGDPTHVRPIIPDSLAMFSQAANREWIARGAANTPLGIYLNVDFAMQSVSFVFDEPWQTRWMRKEISKADLGYAMKTHNNVAMEIEMVLRAVKPAGRTARGPSNG